MSKMEDKKYEVVVVSLGDYSLDILMKKKFYAFPRGSRKVGDYFAFYKNKKIASYAKVKESFQGDKSDVGIGYWLHCLPDADPPYEIVRFEKIIDLKKPILKDETGRGKGQIRGVRYTTLKKLLGAKKISELF